MLKKILSLILAGVILFSCGAVVFNGAEVDIIPSKPPLPDNSGIDIIPSKPPLPDNGEILSGCELQSLSTDEIFQAAKDCKIISDDKDKSDPFLESDLEQSIKKICPESYIEYKNADSNKITLDALLQRIWISDNRPVKGEFDEKVDDIILAQSYCESIDIITNEQLSELHIVGVLDCSIAAELLLKYSLFVNMSVSYPSTSNETNQMSKYLKKNNNNSLKFSVIRDDDNKTYKFIYYKNCTEEFTIIVPSKRLPDNGEILQRIGTILYSMVVNNSSNINMKAVSTSEIQLSNNYIVTKSISRMNVCNKSSNIDSSSNICSYDYNKDGELNLLDAYICILDETQEKQTVKYINTHRVPDTEDEIFTYKSNRYDLLLPNCTSAKNNSTFDGWYMGKEDATLWRFVNEQGDIDWLTKEKNGYHRDVLKPDTAIFNIPPQGVTFVAKWLEWTSADAFEWTKNADNKTATLGKYIGTDSNVVIPKSIDGYTVTSIGKYAFKDCTSLTSINIPDSVTSIGHSAFSWCTNLTNITIGNSVTSIGDYAFDGCKSLTSVTMGNSVTSIGYGAFRNCTSLPNIIISDSITSIDSNAFSNCKGLTNIKVDSNNEIYTSIDGVLFTKDMKTLVCYPCGKKDLEYIITSSVTSIGDDAFRNCTSLTSITIPDSVTSIGEWAFFLLHKLNKYYYP